ncbi:MAG TPA: ABC transporter permease [Candidatus Limnocylindrales bacterium]
MTAVNHTYARVYDASVSPGPIALLREGIDDVRSHIPLIRYLAQAEVKKKGANTLLGNVWWVMDPLLQMAVYVMFIEIIRSRSTPDFPLFVLAAILPWKWFTASVQDSTSSVVTQERLIRQIAFPKIVLPIAWVSSGVVDFAFGLIPLAVIMLFFPDRITAYPVLIPVIAVVQYVFTLALGLVVAAGNVFFRDLGNVVRHALRLWWFLSPGLYSISQFEDTPFFKEHHLLLELALLNPFVTLFNAYRSVIYGSVEAGGTNLPPHMPDWVALGSLFVVSVVLIAVATIVFKRLEPSFAKVL